MGDYARGPLAARSRTTIMTVRLASVFVLLAVSATLLGGCAFGSSSSTPGVSTSTSQTTKQPEGLELVRLSTYQGNGITFTYPASWRHRHRGFYTTMTAPIVDLGTQPMVDPCVHSGNSTSCWFPVHHLDQGGVVVMWSTGGGYIDPTHRPAVGVRVHVLRNGCRALGGTEELTARVVLRGNRIYEAEACLRGPNVGAHEGEVRAMLASARRT